MDEGIDIWVKTRACIDACAACAQGCREAMIHSIHAGAEQVRPAHLELMMGCASICETTAYLLTTNSPFAPQACLLCADICDACVEDCKGFDDAHMRACVSACRACAQASRDMPQEQPVGP